MWKCVMGCVVVQMMDALLEIQCILRLQQHKEHLRFCKKDLEGALNVRTTASHPARSTQHG
jgi:hypothetical protein